MAKHREYKSRHPENPPNWYWINGLHDAGIVEVETFDFPFDYNKYVGEKSNYNRNLLISSAAGCILFRNDDIQGFRLGDIPQQVADDIHGYAVIWYVSSSPYKNSPKYLFRPLFICAVKGTISVAWHTQCHLTEGQVNCRLARHK